VFVPKRDQQGFERRIGNLPDIDQQRVKQAAAFINGVGDVHIDSGCGAMADIERLDGHGALSCMGANGWSRREDHYSNRDHKRDGDSSHGCTKKI